VERIENGNKNRKLSLHKIGGRGLNPLKKIIFAQKKMKHTQTISCPYCSSMDLVKNGHSENSTQRWRCNRCHKSFQLNYRYNARKQGVKEQITGLTLNSSGVRDISRILKIGIAILHTA
jgi:transposase-like protein